MSTYYYGCQYTSLDGCHTSTQHCTTYQGYGQAQAQTMPNPTFGYDCPPPQNYGGYAGAQAQTGAVPPAPYPRHYGYHGGGIGAHTSYLRNYAHHGGVAQAQTMPNPTFSGCNPPFSATPLCWSPTHQPYHYCANTAVATGSDSPPATAEAQTMPKLTFHNCQPSSPWSTCITDVVDYGLQGAGAQAHIIPTVVACVTMGRGIRPLYC